MKKIFLSFTMISLSLVSFAQTGEEIIAKCLETMGGEKKMDGINSIRMTAKIDQMGMSIPLEMINLRNGKMIMKANFQGQEFVQMAFDGSSSWSTNFMTMKAEKNESEDTENIKRQSLDFIMPIYQYKQKGYIIEKLADETIEGASCFKIKMTKKTSLSEGKEVPNIEFYYFDKDNFVPIVVEAEIPSGESKGMITQTLFSDYQEVDGIYFPFSITNKMKGSDGQAVMFTKVEINPVIEDKIFLFPGE